MWNRDHNSLQGRTRRDDHASDEIWLCGGRGSFRLGGGCLKSLANCSKHLQCMVMSIWQKMDCVLNTYRIEPHSVDGTLAFTVLGYLNRPFSAILVLRVLPGRNNAILLICQSEIRDHWMILPWKDNSWLYQEAGKEEWCCCRDPRTLLHCRTIQPSEYPPSSHGTLEA